ncbi:hypothetical protein TELCIR_21033, partial [Teladorsagia circumcincta]
MPKISFPNFCSLCFHKLGRPVQSSLERASQTKLEKDTFGVQIYNSPYTYVSADPDQVAVQKESLSRLEYMDILYAGYD